MRSSASEVSRTRGSISSLAVTIDLDWASEVAIEETLEFLDERQIPVTIFTTHRSACIEARLSRLEVGLHPYFGEGSSHGQSIDEVVGHVMELPHNLPAFRCHRFAVSNEARQALRAAGLQISSNVCTDMELVPPFFDRFRLLEIPIFLEDGGYLYQRHALTIDQHLEMALAGPGTRVLLLHPMHFAINTPHFDYMAQIKRSVSRQVWNDMTKANIETLRWRGRGIRDFLTDLFDCATRIDMTMTTLGSMARTHTATRTRTFETHHTSSLLNRA